MTIRFGINIIEVSSLTILNPDSMVVKNDFHVNDVVSHYIFP